MQQYVCYITKNYVIWHIPTFQINSLTVQHTVTRRQLVQQHLATAAQLSYSGRYHCSAGSLQRQRSWCNTDHRQARQQPGERDPEPLGKSRDSRTVTVTVTVSDRHGGRCRPRFATHSGPDTDRNDRRARRPSSARFRPDCASAGPPP